MSDNSTPGPMSFAVEGWTVWTQRGLPAFFDSYATRALLVDTYLSSDEGGTFFAAVGNNNDGWPSLVVAQRFWPCEGGFEPGVALVSATQTVFVGAGTRLLAYRLGSPPVRLWEDYAAVGFLHWSVHPNAVLMAGELEFAAWDLAGTKLWSRQVEPPWDYGVTDGRVKLDVTGTVTEFDIVTGR